VIGHDIQKKAFGHQSCYSEAGTELSVVKKAFSDRQCHSVVVI
jgi:hypothetical protein